VSYAGIADQLAARGHGRIDLGPAERAALGAVRDQAARFFALPDAAKRRHGDADGLNGWRPHGMQFSDDPALPDQCESFAFWAGRGDLVPAHAEIRSFTAALGEWWLVTMEIAGEIMGQLARRYRHPRALAVGPSSYLEVNSYDARSDRELLQTRHEDGHLVSLVVPDRPGLEIEEDGRMRPARAREGQMLVMPGSLLTAMTGGEIRPLYHQVRNHQYPQRTTVLAFVNTPFHGDYPPYRVGDDNQDVTMAELSREKCAMFGKPLPPPGLL
jgi:isopenicillin N synthase-like dioxygenase